MTGNKIYQLAERLFPICRSITGDGVRQTLAIIQDYLPELRIEEVPSGTEVFDWTVPQEWKIYEAYIEDSSGKRVIDFRQNNLHVIGYSDELDIYGSKEELQPYIYVQEKQPELIPYITAYYSKKAGFCMSKNMWDGLPEDAYHAVIRSEFVDGSMTFGEVVIQGETEKEVLLSTYICHPSMANNELSGPCLCTFLADWIQKMPNRKYTYRILFIPETIGAITYISRNLVRLKKNVIAGFVVSCVGDERAYSYIPSRNGNTLADRAAKNALHFMIGKYDKYTFLDRASDERQYNAPGVDLPVCVVCRSKYGTYPEYHTSADDMSFISARGLEGSWKLYQRIILNIERNAIYQVKCLCEPQLGRRGLYPMISRKDNFNEADAILNFLTYADGTNDVLEISHIINLSTDKIWEIADRLLEQGLIEEKI